MERQSVCNIYHHYKLLYNKPVSDYPTINVLQSLINQLNVTVVSISLEWPTTRFTNCFYLYLQCKMHFG